MPNIKYAQARSSHPGTSFEAERTEQACDDVEITSRFHITTPLQPRIGVVRWFRYLGCLLYLAFAPAFISALVGSTFIPYS